MSDTIEPIERDYAYILTYVPEAEYVDYPTAVALADERCEAAARGLLASIGSGGE